MTHSLFNKISLYPLMLAIFFAGCNGLPPGFQKGKTVNIQVDVAENGTVTDDFTGTTFVFPEGGDGTLTIAELTATPDTPFEGTFVALSFSGAAPFNVRLPPKGDVRPLVMYYGRPNGLYEGIDSTKDRWNVVPYTLSGDDYDFSLPAPDNAAQSAAALQRAGMGIQAVYTGNSILVGFGDEANTANNETVRAQVESYANTALSQFPAGLQSAATSRLNFLCVTFIPRFNLLGIEEDPYYSPFSRDWTLRRQTTPTIIFTDDVTATTLQVPHETAHFITHMLISDGAMSAMQSLAPPAGHGPGVCYDKRTYISLVDDYAYVFQDLNVRKWKMGSAPGHNGSGWLVSMAANYGCTYDPMYTDLPAMEGFGTIIVGMMDRRGGTGLINDFYNQLQTIPEFPVQDGFEDLCTVVSKGAESIEKLAAAMEAYYQEKGLEGGFAVVAERLGWSYMANLQISKPSLPAGGHETFEITSSPMMVKGVSYAWAGGYLDFGSGKIQVTRLFKGKNTITVKYAQYNSSSARVYEKTVTKEVTIDWAKKTNEPVSTLSIDLN